MKVDEKFHKATKTKKVECSSAQTSMNLAPEGEWSKEEERVTIRFRPDSEDDTRHLTIKMSRIEAKVLGSALVRYGSMSVDGENPSKEATA